VRNFIALTEAIEYIEYNLCRPFRRGDVAAHCHISLSALEKLFRYALHRSIKEYITKRRMTRAAEDLIKGELSVTETAMKYMYNSPEVFSRSFRQVWNVNPSEFASVWKFSGLFPKINYKYTEGDDFEMARKRVDLSESYDYLKEKRGSFVLCFDIRNLTAINNISTRAGDLAILEAAKRIDDAATDDMLTLRIGGDEFALITGCRDIEKAKQTADKITSLNDIPIIFEGKALPLFLWAGITTVPETSLRYSEFFTDLHNTIERNKQAQPAQLSPAGEKPK
jgi:AraC family transcriptional regulator